jgi:hypothetical protein
MPPRADSICWRAAVDPLAFAPIPPPGARPALVRYPLKLTTGPLIHASLAWILLCLCSAR